MVQKEIADRLLAGTHCKEYGILSVLAGSHAKIIRLFNVKRNNFYPVPKVDSSIIKMEMVENIDDISDYAIFQKIVRGCFNTRRKMLQNSLKRYLSAGIINKIKSVPLTVRPEELSIQDFKNLANETARLTENNHNNN